MLNASPNSRILSTLVLVMLMLLGKGNESHSAEIFAHMPAKQKSVIDYFQKILPGFRAKKELTGSIFIIEPPAEGTAYVRVLSQGAEVNGIAIPVKKEGDNFVKGKIRMILDNQKFNTGDGGSSYNYDPEDDDIYLLTSGVELHVNKRDTAALNRVLYSIGQSFRRFNSRVIRVVFDGGETVLRFRRVGDLIVVFRE